MQQRRRPARAAIALIVLAAGAAAPLGPAVTERVSVDPAGLDANADSGYLDAPAVSGDGRFVAFQSVATDLVPDDTNDRGDIFVRDRQTATTERVSVSSSGLQANFDSRMATISADGRFVAFASGADNLVPDDTNQAFDVFVHDRQTGTTVRVSVSPSGAEGNRASVPARISADGRFVAFTSFADNLVPDDMNQAFDLFVRDREMGTTGRVNVSTTGSEANGGIFSAFAISADGRVLAFDSDADNLVPRDANGASDVFVRDRQTGTTERVSVSSGGLEGNRESYGAAVSADGRFVAFVGFATNLVPGDRNDRDDIFVRDRQTGTTERVSLSSSSVEADDGSFAPAISADGRFVAFRSLADNLVAGDSNQVADIFVRDRQTGITERISVSSSGSEANDRSDDATISADGNFVVFTSAATNLVPGDRNEAVDVFLRSIMPTTTTTVTVSTTTTSARVATTTTLVCTSVRCLLDAALASPACAGSAVPPKVTTKLAQAIRLVEQLTTSSARKSRKLRGRARKILRHAKAIAAKAARGKTPRVSPDCAAMIAAATDGVLSGLRM